MGILDIVVVLVVGSLVTGFVIFSIHIVKEVDKLGRTVNGDSLRYGLEYQISCLRNRVGRLREESCGSLEGLAFLLEKGLKEDIQLVIETDSPPKEVFKEVFLSKTNLKFNVLLSTEGHRKSIPVEDIIKRARELRELKSKLCCNKKKTPKKKAK